VAEEIDYLKSTRAWKVRCLLALFDTEQRTPDEVAHWTIPEWSAAAHRAGILMPSQDTRREVMDTFTGARSARLTRSVAAHAAPPRSRRTAR
jgi:hypothetical protein